MILEHPWICQQDVHFNHMKDKMLIHHFRTTVANLEQEVPEELCLDCVIVNTAGFNLASKHKKAQVFTASIKDVEKALKMKTCSDPREKLLKNYHQ